MKPKTVLHCFLLLLIVSFVVLITEVVISSLTGAKLSPLYEILPISSSPFVGKKIKELDKATSRGNSQTETQHSLPVQVTLYLTNGSEIIGKLVSEDQDWVTVNYEGSIVGFHRSEISQISKTEA